MNKYKVTLFMKSGSSTTFIHESELKFESDVAKRFINHMSSCFIVRQDPTTILAVRPSEIESVQVTAIMV